MEHLLELRSRLFIAFLAVGVATILMWFFFNPVWDFLKQPYCDLPQEHRFNPNGECTLFVNGIFEGFNIRLKVSVILGVVISSPIWIYQLWSFITPGLRSREKRWTYTFVGAAVPLFFLGAVLAYFTLDKGLAFFLGVNANDVTALITVSSYLGFFLAMLLVFGLSFEFPLLVIVLNMAGLLTYARLRQWWRGITVGIFVFAAVVTPSPDPITMSVLAVPMVGMYWVAALIARVHDRRKAEREAQSPYAGLSDDETSPLDAAYDPSA